MNVIESLMEFLYYLFKKESDAWTEGDNKEANKWHRSELVFIDSHLGCWGPIFCSKIQKESNHPFYCSISIFAGIILKQEGSNTTNPNGNETPPTIIK